MSPYPADTDLLAPFDFDLPEELIALHPASPRESARLLGVASQSQATHNHTIDDLPDLLSPSDLLVLNDTRVIAASLSASRASRDDENKDVTFSILLLKKHDNGKWDCLIKPSKRMRPGDCLSVISPSGSALIVAFTCLSSIGNGVWRIQFNMQGAELDNAIEQLGAPPLPPYILQHRSVSERDKIDYQTIYAKNSGAVAAPTAGLHITENLLHRFSEKGIDTLHVTLHTGMGTFRPISNETVLQRRLHAESIEISDDVARKLNAARASGRRIVSVGTTTLRALEASIRASTDNSRFVELYGETDLFIQPGETVFSSDVLLTNFHLPRSSLFMLVCAFAGTEKMRHAYERAIAQRYRFFSYGDACLLHNHSKPAHNVEKT